MLWSSHHTAERQFTYIQYILYFGLHRGCDWVCSSWQQTSWQTSLSDAVTSGPSHGSHPLNHHTAVQKNPRNTMWDIFSIWLEALIVFTCNCMVTLCLPELSFLLPGCSPAWSPAESTTSTHGLLELWILLSADILWLLMMWWWCEQSGSLRLLWKALGGAAQWSLQRTERSSNVCQLFFQPAPCAVMCFCKAGLTKGKRKMTYFRPLT